MPLGAYRRKRDFRATSEPRGKRKHAPRARGLLYVIQKHAASHLHYDFRLELDGVLKSWAIPKGPSLDPGDKRLAVEVEDHPVEYGSFEGTIPKGQYGGGSVLLWDRGTWTPTGDAHDGLRRGNLKFELQGEKLRGRWVLVRLRGREEEDTKKNWLLIKERDPDAGRKRSSSKDILKERPESVLSGRTIEDVGKNVWQSNRPETKTKPAKTEKTRRPARAVVPESIPGARAASLPSFVPPQLATLVSQAPVGEDWVHEIKYDGYRFLCRIDRGRARLLTRSGLDWTDRFPSVADAATKLPADRAILDGELVVLRPDGVSSFQDLQNAMRGGREDDLVFFVFDLLHFDGFDLTAVPLLARKEALAGLLASATAAIRFSDHVPGRGSDFYREACRRKLEGIVSKRANATYTSGRTGAWLKTKCSARQEFVIGGYTEPQGSRSHLGALLLGVTNGGNGLRYSGKVGTGFTQESLRDLERRLAPLQVGQPPFVDAPRMRDAHWVKPRLVAEVAFTGWTEDGKLRHPSFQGLREDKPAREVVAEKAKRPRRPKGRTPTTPARRRPPRKPPRRKPPVRDPVSKPPLREPPPRGRSPIREPDDTEGASSAAGVRISHPDRILYPGPMSSLNIATVPSRLGRKDPWSATAGLRQTITAAMLRSLRQTR